MNGGTPLIDKLLATPSMARSDLVPLKGQLALLQPNAVTDAEPLANDTRLPSRAAVGRQLGVASSATSASAQPGSAPSTIVAERGATLSPAARIISEILGGASARSEAVRGNAPLWAAAAPPLPPQLAAALARAVSDSGLFYEAHLLQFASGTRSLAQLMHEPQASLGQAASQPGAGVPQAAPEQNAAPQTAAEPGKLPPPQQALVALAQLVPTSDPTPGALMQASAQASVHSNPASQSSAGAAASSSPTHSESGNSQTQPTSLGANPHVHAGAVDIAAAYRAGAMDFLYRHERQDGIDSAATAANADTVSPPQATGSMVHPDAIALVRQQLELMALSQFRWTGEAWPGAKAEWDIEEHQRQPDGADAVPRRWSTRLAMTLPKLGNVELRLTLLGDRWHAQLAAKDETSLASMRADSAGLQQRFQLAGMHLSEVQLRQLSVSTPDNTASGKNSDSNQ